MLNVTTFKIISVIRDMLSTGIWYWPKKIKRGIYSFVSYRKEKACVANVFYVEFLNLILDKAFLLVNLIAPVKCPG